MSSGVSRDFLSAWESIDVVIEDRLRSFELAGFEAKAGEAQVGRCEAGTRRVNAHNCQFDGLDCNRWLHQRSLQGIIAIANSRQLHTMDAKRAEYSTAEINCPSSGPPYLICTGSKRAMKFNSGSHSRPPGSNALLGSLGSCFPP